MMELKSEKNMDNFIQEIDKMVSEMGIDYIDAVVHFCERENIEIEVAAKIIKTNQRMKAQVQSDAETLNFLPKRAKLPV